MPETNEQNKDVAEALLRNVQENRHQPWEFIKSTRMCKAAKIYRSAMEKIADSFAKQARGFMQKYLDGLKAGTPDVKFLITYRDFKLCADFYEQEVKTCDDMLDEYRCFFNANWHFITIGLLGFERREEDMVDYRTLPLKIF